MAHDTANVAVMMNPANPIQHSLALSHARLYIALRHHARGEFASAVDLLDQLVDELTAVRAAIAAIAAAHGLPVSTVSA